MGQATSAPFPFTIGDRHFTLTPLRLVDIDELDNWLKKKYFESARAALTPDMTADERKELLSLALDRASQMSFISGNGAKMFATIDGIAQLFYVSAKIAEPAVTYDECVTALMDPSALEEFDVLFAKMNQADNRVRAPKKNPTKGKGRKRHKRRR